jgi:TrmH RNA methyltransferase
MKKHARTEIIAGSAAVAALFARRPESVQRLFFSPARMREAKPYLKLLAKSRRPYRELPPDEMRKVAATSKHGGIVAIAAARTLPYIDPATNKHSFLLCLDGVSNPHNLGAIARSAAFFGTPAILFGEDESQALLSGAAYRTSEGGLEHLDLYKTRNLAKTLRQFNVSRNYLTVATMLGADAVPLSAVSRDRPIALVLGNEERGVSSRVAGQCLHNVCLAGSGSVQSLNVAQTAAVLLHEFRGAD